MSKEQKTKYTEELKDAIKGFLDNIDTSDDFGQRIIELIYGFSRSGYREYSAGKGGASV